MDYGPWRGLLSIARLFQLSRFRQAALPEFEAAGEWKVASFEDGNMASVATIANHDHVVTTATAINATVTALVAAARSDIGRDNNASASATTAFGW